MRIPLLRGLRTPHCWPFHFPRTKARTISSWTKLAKQLNWASPSYLPPPSLLTPSFPVSSLASTLLFHALSLEPILPPLCSSHSNLWNDLEGSRTQPQWALGGGWHIPESRLQTTCAIPLKSQWSGLTVLQCENHFLRLLSVKTFEKPFLLLWVLKYWLTIAEGHGCRQSFSTAQKLHLSILNVPSLPLLCLRFVSSSRHHRESDSGKLSITVGLLLCLKLVSFRTLSFIL